MLQTVESRRLLNDMLRVLGLALDMDEGVKLNHAWRVAVLAHEMGALLDPKSQGDLYRAGLLHDIGGIGIEDHTVHHAVAGFRRSDARQHPAIGARILRPLSLLEGLADAVAHHHERVDGHGFPLGLAAEQIPTSSSVLLMADMLEVAMRQEEPEHRHVAALGVTRMAKGSACPPAVADAAYTLLAHNPAVVPALYDDAELRSLVLSIDPESPNLSGISRRAMLAQILGVIARVVDAKHTHTVGHSLRVAFFARQIAKALGGVANEWDVVWAGLLHDVGNLAVPRVLLDRRRALLPEEWAVVKQHAERTREFVASITDLAYLAPAASSHHECYDGTGYPLGLAEEEIPLIARIIAYADVFDALTSHRAHREAVPYRRAAEMIRGMAGTSLDPHLADIAIPALLAGGSEVGEYVARGFSALVESDKPNLAQVIREDAVIPSQPGGAPGGALLLDLEPWSTVILSSRLWIVSGGDALRELMPGHASDHLLDFLDQRSGSRLLEAAQTLKRRQTHTQYLFSVRGVPVEAAISRAHGGFRLMVRSARNRLQTMERMALFYRNFLSSVHGVAFMDPDGNVLDVNRAFLDMYHLQLRDIVGKSSSVLRPADMREERVSVVEAVNASANGSWSGEVEHVTGDGTTISVQVALSSLRDSNAICIGYIGQYLDVTEQRRAERELAAASEALMRKNEELEQISRFKSDLMAITSHDIRSPLAAVMSAVDLLRSQMGRIPEDRVQSYLDRMADSTRQVLRLVEDILDLEKAESGRFQLHVRRVLLDRVVQRCVDTVATACGERLRFKLHAHEPLGTVVLDPTRMEQVFSNLLANAAKFAPDGSEVLVECETRADGSASVSVADRGPGIPVGDLDSIFDRYYQVARRGSVPKRGFGVGLGLTIVRTIVELHGGRVRVENRDGGGCRFVVDLPSRDAAQSSELPALVIAASDARPQLMVEMLARVGVSAVVAGSADEAQRICDYERPALIVVFETVLSRGLVRLLRAMREAPGRPPVLVCVRAEPASGVGLFDHELVAPVVDVELFEVVKEIRLHP